MRKSLMILIGLLALTATTVVKAQEPDIDNDLRCIALASLKNMEMEPDKQSAGFAAVMYFVGRIDAVASDIDLETELKRVSESLKQQEKAIAEWQRCSLILKESALRLIAVGSALQAKK